MQKALNAYVAWGDAILVRLAALESPGAVVTTWRDKLSAVQEQLRAGNDFADQAWKARHDVITEVADAEAQVEGGLEALADALPGEGVGTRKNPFAGLTEVPMSRLHALGHLHLAEEATGIANGVRAKVAKKGKASDAIATIDANVKAIRAGVAKIEGVENAFHHAVRSRDTVLIEWHGILAKLRRRVEVHFEDQPKEARAIFAPPSVVVLQEPAPNTKDAKAEKKAEAAAAKAAAKAAKAAAKEAAAATKAARKAAKAAAKNAATATPKKPAKRRAK
jgi:hypothetical protein